MSITFTAEYRDGDITGYQLTCRCETPSGPVYPTHDAAIAGWKATPVPPCDMSDCFLDWDLAHVGFVYALEIPEVNVSNANGHRLLQLLNVPFDYSGSIDADDLAGRAAIALGLLHLAPAAEPVTDPIVEGFRASGMTVIECGRSEGWDQMRLIEIAELAAWAAAHHRRIRWA